MKPNNKEEEYWAARDIHDNLFLFDEKPIKGDNGLFYNATVNSNMYLVVGKLLKGLTLKNSPCKVKLILENEN
jgi:hypothetical protein